jgi:hypothetical protein
MGATKPPTPHEAQGGNTDRGDVLPWCRTRDEAQTSARRSDQHGQTSGGRRRGTSQWETICSTCSPTAGGRQYRVRDDVRARLVGELGASVDQTASGPPPTSNPRLPEPDSIFIIPGVA